MAARYSPYIRVVQFTSDLVILNASLFAAFLYKFGSLQDPFQNLLVYFNVTWVFLVVYFKPYNLSRITTLNRVLRVQLGLVVLHLLLASVFYVLQLQSQYSRSFLFYHYAIFAGVGLTWRGVFLYLMRNYRRQGFNYRKIIIIGWGRQAEEMGKLFQQRPEYGYKLLGFFDNEVENDQVLGRLSEVRAFVEAEEVDEIYCFMPSLDHNTIKELVEFGEENLIRIKLITDFKGISYKGMEMERYGDFPVIHVMVSPLDAPSSRFMKRAFDMVFSLTVITLLLSWLVPIIGLLVKLSSRGPVFFKQQRTGKNNAQFTCYKFRTMRVNAEADSVQATRDDPRVTGIGSFLRKTSLDELPQFLNVLRGDMSVVGPRPHMLKHTEEYTKLTGKFMARHAIKPGITGLAQVKGFRGEIQSEADLKNRVKLDRFYVENWSLMLDLKIILYTIGFVFKPEGHTY